MQIPSDQTAVFPGPWPSGLSSDPNRGLPAQPSHGGCKAAEPTPRPPPVPITGQMPCTDVPVCFLGQGWPWSPHSERKDQAHGGPGRGRQEAEVLRLLRVCPCVCLLRGCMCVPVCVCVSVWGDAHVGYVCLCVHASACTYVFLYMCSCIPLCVCMCVCVCACLCLCVCVCTRGCPCLGCVCV